MQKIRKSGIIWRRMIVHRDITRLRKITNILDESKRLVRLGSVSAELGAIYSILDSDGVHIDGSYIKVFPNGNISIFPEDGRISKDCLFDLLPKEAKEDLIWNIDSLY
jgi:hypothetical protein